MTKRKAIPETVADLRARCTDDGECWLWNGPSAGIYGYVNLGNGKRESAHRFAYRLRYGEVPDGLVVDHLCRNPKCVRPEHLEAVTGGENTNRGAANRSLGLTPYCPKRVTVRCGACGWKSQRSPASADDPCPKCRAPAGSGPEDPDGVVTITISLRRETLRDIERVLELAEKSAKART